MTLLIFVFFSSFKIVRKNLVQFVSEDGIMITADHYFTREGLPYVLLLHQEMSSRGEFDSIAERIAKMGYNCLAVDLRSGNKFGYVENETVKSALEKINSAKIMDALKDITASVDYAWNLSGQKIVILASGSSASLALIEAKTNDHVKAVIALSPGEYFRPELEMKSYLSGFSKMVFIGCTDLEFPFMQEMFSEVDNNKKIIFRPGSGPGARGTTALLNENPTRDEYWLSLLLFFRTIR